jgi:peptide/nickel transport system permease protein
MMAVLARRTAWAVVTLWLVVTGSFALAFLLPADPARMVAGPHSSPETVERIRVELGLDKPVPVQYARYLSGLVHGDLGMSYRTHRPVRRLIAEALPRTALLAAGAGVVQLLIGIPIGLVAALRRRSWVDLAAMAVALVGISAPTFLVGLALMIGLGFHLRWFPIGGLGEGWDILRHAALPSLTLGIAGAAYYSRLTRGEYLDVAQKDFMRTARAKGLHERAVVLRHGLRNALLPVVTFFGLDMGSLLGGAIVTESLFAWPGVGQLAVQSVLNQDIPVMLGTVLVASVAMVLANLVVDVLYVFVDPRIRSA